MISNKTAAKQKKKKGKRAKSKVDNTTTPNGVLFGKSLANSSCVFPKRKLKQTENLLGLVFNIISKLE